MPFDDRLLHVLVVKRMAPALGGAAETAGGADTSLSVDSAIGEDVVAVADATGIADGDWLRVGDVGETEIRQVSTGGVVGLLVMLTEPLGVRHDSGDGVREVDDEGAVEVDDYGQPVFAPTTVATVPGLIQPRSAREVFLSTSAGAAIGDHLAYMRPLAALTTDCWIERDGIRYDVVSIADAAGIGHHFEIGLRRIA
jgi:hypothetical protein